MMMAWFDVFVIMIEFSDENGQPESINCRSKSDQIPIQNVKYAGTNRVFRCIFDQYAVTIKSKHYCRSMNVQ